MATRRMFAKSVVESDRFLEMPLEAQALYFHLGMHADDDGFINNPKMIIRMIGASASEWACLLENEFIILFDSGVAVVKHWKMNNLIKSDRYRPAIHLEERAMLVMTIGQPYEFKCE